ncbi:hypothetical protein [Streptomyces sp. Ag109_O5-10]|uniref:hypothetical protein n=1 Tax=Streptomyces sp. Ag109_O5-10 TaxID=1855349 RepID=UPI002109ECCE|nr:hypothetical protein [Streptomyces sp. Ag109_O5-10]
MRAEDGGDGEGAAAFGESEGEDQAAGPGGEQDGEGELDAVSPARSTEVRLVPTVPRVWVRPVTVARVPSCPRGWAAIRCWFVPPVSRRKAPTEPSPVAWAT